MTSEQARYRIKLSWAKGWNRMGQCRMSSPNHNGVPSKAYELFISGIFYYTLGTQWTEADIAESEIQVRGDYCIH